MFPPLSFSPPFLQINFQKSLKIIKVVYFLQEHSAAQLQIQSRQMVEFIQNQGFSRQAYWQGEVLMIHH